MEREVDAALRGSTQGLPGEVGIERVRAGIAARAPRNGTVLTVAIHYLSL